MVSFIVWLGLVVAAASMGAGIAIVFGEAVNEPACDVATGMPKRDNPLLPVERGMDDLSLAGDDSITTK